jgi:hypothetical protein
VGAFVRTRCLRGEWEEKSESPVRAVTSAPTGLVRGVAIASTGDDKRGRVRENAVLEG